MTARTTSRTARALHRIAVIALLLTVGVATAQAQVKTRDHRGQKKPPPPPPPPADQPPPPPPPEPAPAAWQSKGWQMLGEVQVAGRKTKASIAVGSYRGRFDQLTVVVLDAEVEVKKFVVQFANGEKFDPKVKHDFNEGARTRAIDLPGNNRLISKIDLTLKGVRGSGRATVQVWGRDTRGNTEQRPKQPAFEPTGWEQLGTLKTDKRGRRDTIKIGRKDGAFTKVAFVIEDDDLELYDVRIVFGNGEEFSPKTRMFFDEDSRTGAIDLPGEKRFIKQIEFEYRNIGRGKKATIVAWGMPAKAEVARAPEFDPTGWEKLGTLQTDKRGRRDTITVGRDDGRFTKVTFVVRDDDLEIFDVKITFGNGETFSPKTRMSFKEDSRTGVIDLPGDKRFIKKIEFDYKNTGRGKKASIVAWGMPAKDDGGSGGKVDTRDHRKQRTFAQKDWQMLGEQEVNGQNDFDVISVGAKEGKFKQITLAVVDGAMNLDAMTVHFKNGKDLEIQGAVTFDEGSWTQVIDLPGNKRGITKITLRYSKASRKAAKIQVWAK